MALSIGLRRLKTPLTAGLFALFASVGVAAEVSVFAAASLSEVLKDVATDFEAQTGHRVVLSLAGSSALARQIEYGAPADVFVSANAAWTEHLTTKGMLLSEGQRVLYGNDLVLIAPADSIAVEVPTSKEDFDLLLSEGRLAMALVDAVPAGIYGRQAFENMGIWQSVAPRVAQVDNVRSALALVALGEAAAGVVYATDALADERVRVLSVLSSDLHDPIVYPASVVSGSDRPEVADFMNFLSSEDARSAFSERGFRVLEDDG